MRANAVQANAVTQRFAQRSTLSQHARTLKACSTSLLLGRCPARCIRLHMRPPGSLPLRPQLLLRPALPARLRRSRHCARALKAPELPHLTLSLLLSQPLRLLSTPSYRRLPPLALVRLPPLRADPAP